MGDLIFVFLLISSALVVFGFLLIPIYLLLRPQNVEMPFAFYACQWMIGIIPVLVIIAAGIMSTFPNLQGRGGEPGLNFGYDVIPIILGAILIFIAHILAWVLLVLSRMASRSRSEASSA